MASPTHRSSSNNTGSSTGFTATEPTGAASGDGLLLLVLVALAHSSIVPPALWTPVPSCNALDAGTSFTAYMYYLLRGGSAPALNMSWTTSQYYEWSVHAFPGVVGASFIDASAATASTSTANPDPPSIVTTTDDTLICAITYTWAGFASGGASPPSGYALRFGAVDYDHGIATLAKGAAGSVDPGTFGNTNGSDVTRSMTVALAGSAGGGGGAVTPVDHSSVSSFPALCRRPQNDNGRWIRSKGGLWQPRRAA